MKLRNLFDTKQVLSFEVFPPKRTAPVESIYDALDSLKNLHPDFISVTYGAGGSKNCAATLEIASSIKNKYGIESVAHLPCIYLSKEDVLEMESRTFLRCAGIAILICRRERISGMRAI